MDALGLIARFTTFAAIFIALGAVVFRVHVLRRAVVNAQTVTRASTSAARLALIAATAIVPAALVRLALQTSAMRFPDDPWLGVALRLVRETSWGLSWMAQVGAALALVPALLVARGGSVARWMPAALLALALAITPSTTSHAMNTERFGALPFIADALHVTLGAAWLGTLCVIFNSVQRKDAMGSDSNRYLAELLRAFSPMAIACALLIVTSGVFGAVAHIPTVAALTSSAYGQRLLVKSVAVALVALLGLRNWRVLTPQLANGRAGPMQRSIALELVLAAVVLGLTAWLVVTPPPMEAMAMS